MTNCDNYSVFLPTSILSADRYELSNLPLKIEGQLPEDIQGHFFMVAPVGSVDSAGLPYPSGDSILSGDGMIYRLDFNQSGQVTVKTKLVAPPDYYADLATRPGSKYAQYGFRNHGVTRFSLTLGLRNQLNTAFLPMPFSSNSQQRLLVTYDAGRPYEIDTETLETVTPVGANTEWTPEVEGINFPFQPVLSTAHPVFDSYTEEMFTVNYGRSLKNFTKTIPLISKLEKLSHNFKDTLSNFSYFVDIDLFRYTVDIVSGIFNNINKELGKIIEEKSGIELKNFVYLDRWDGYGNLERWKLILPDGSPVVINQTIHQIGLSKDYIILMDTSFITGIEQTLNNPFPENKKIEEALRELSEKPENPDSVIYIISRCDLNRGQYPILGESEVEVIAKKVTIPLEAAHFLVDYDNPNGHVTLHVAHNCAWDIAEWIRRYDVSAYNKQIPTPERVQAMDTTPMDIGRLGRYVVDAEKAELINSQVICENPYTWGTGLYAYLDRLSSGLPPSRLENIYWCSLGLWPELMTEYAVRLYKDYKYRMMPLSEVLELAKNGVPSCLLRVDTSQMIIADAYELPKGYIASSPQFIPRQGSQGGSKDGYLICTVFTPTSNEFWLFDGDNLKKGPICKLSHPSLNFGFTLHTTWLPTINPRQATYNVPVTLDYQQLVNEQSDPQIKELFDKKIYPYFS